MELEKLAVRHKDWIQMVESFGCNSSESEDVVQDAYLKIYDRIQNGLDISYGEDDVNGFYMYMTLRSIYLNSVSKRKCVWNSIVDSSQENLEHTLNSIKAEYADVEMEDSYARLMDKIWSEVNTWDFYSRNIFTAYFTTNFSLTKLSEETKIGRSSLYNSVKQYRDVIKDMFSEDVEDFNNKDFNLIK